MALTHAGVGPTPAHCHNSLVAPCCPPTPSAQTVVTRVRVHSISTHTSGETAGSVSEVRELQRHAEVVLAHLLDRRLQVVALLAGHAELVALHLVLHAFEAEALDELSDLSRLFVVD